MPEPLDRLPSTETLFARWLELHDRGEKPAIDQLCSLHPDHADGLRALHREWRRDESDAKRIGGGGGAPLDDDPVGTERGGFRFLRVLGRGGMGVVYEAEQIATGQRLALKILPPDVSADPERRTRLEREARLAARISHPSCVFVYGVFDVDGAPAIAMERMPGETLEDRLRAGDAVPIHVAVRWTLDVLDGLEAAAAAGVVHRDVKPSNCFLTPDGRVKLGDFGLSLPGVDDVRVTKEGTYVGTPSYSSPEQIRGNTLDVRSDLFAVGGLLYSLLTGRVPFPARTSEEALARILVDPPDPVRAHRPDVPKALDRTIRRLLAKDPERRFKSVAAVRRRLEVLALEGSAEVDTFARAFSMLLAPLIAWFFAGVIFVNLPLSDPARGFLMLASLMLIVPIWIRIAPLLGLRVATVRTRRNPLTATRGGAAAVTPDAPQLTRSTPEGRLYDVLQEVSELRGRRLLRSHDRRVSRSVLLLEGREIERPPAPHAPDRPMPIRLLTVRKSGARTQLVFEDPGGGPLLDDIAESNLFDWPTIRRAIVDLAVELQWRESGIPLDHLWIDAQRRLRVLDAPSSCAAPDDRGRPIETLREVARSLLGDSPEARHTWKVGVPLRAEATLEPLISGHLDDRDVESVRVALASLAALPSVSRARRSRLAIATVLATLFSWLMGGIYLANFGEPPWVLDHIGPDYAAGLAGCLVVIVLSLFTGGGAMLRASGLGLRTSRGERATKLRCAWRSVIAFGTPLGLMLLYEAARVNGSAQWILNTLVGATFTVIAAGVISVIISPDRAIHDRLAGTRVVPR